jgi:ribose 5-phosphate isomerase B
MKIALASDHAGFRLKQEIVALLREMDLEFRDYGCDSEESVNYVDYGAKACRAVLAGECDRAVLFCGTGLGMAIVANKFKGIRATPCWDEFTASVSRKHNNANCLTLGGRVLDPEAARAILRTWLATEFEGGRHSFRVGTILALEDRNFKAKTKES